MNLSGILLLSGIALGTSISLNLVSYQEIDNLIQNELDVKSSITVLSSLLVLPLAIFLTWLLRRLEWKKNSVLLNHAQAIEPFKIDGLQQYRSQIEPLISESGVHFFQIGSFKNYIDHGGPLLGSAKYMRAAVGNENGAPCIVLPVGLLYRLRSSPAALAAIVAHELAHISNRDLELTYDIGRFLRILGIGFFIITLLTIVQSILSDITHYEESLSVLEWTRIVWASIIGKFYLIASFFLVVLSAAAVSSIKWWREALADHVAISTLGESALKRAEVLIGGIDDYGITESQQRANRETTKTALTGNAWLLMLFGASIDIFSASMSGPFAYLSDHAVETESMAKQFKSMGVFIETVILAVGLWFLVVSGETIVRKTDSIKPIIMRFIYFSLGVLLARSVYQAIPLIVTSVGMPDGFDFIFRHEPLPLLFEMWFDNGVRLLGLCLLFLSFLTFKKRWVFFPVLAWCVVSSLEEWTSFGLPAGILAPLCTVSMALTMILNYRGHVSIIETATRSLVAMTGVGVLVFGGSYSYIARHIANAGLEEFNNGNPISAMSAFEKTVKLSPWSDQGWRMLAISRLNTEGATESAINAAHRASTSPLAHNWQSIFNNRMLLGELLLIRRSEGDIDRAIDVYDTALRQWRANSRLNKHNVIGMLYNQAAAMSQVGKSSMALLRLLEAITEANALEPTLPIAIDALYDPDFSSLNLAIPESMTNESYKLLFSRYADDIWIKNEALIRSESYNLPDLEKFLRYSIQRSYQ